MVVIGIDETRRVADWMPDVSVGGSCMRPVLYLEAVAIVGVLWIGAAAARSEPASFPDREWVQYATPKDAGYDADKLAEARRWAEQAGSAAVFIVQSGHVVAAWGDIQRKFKCHSVRKSLLNALIGIHVAEGHIDLEESLADLGIDDIEPLSEREKRAKVIDLLQARSGVYHPAAKEPPSIKRSRPPRGSHAPGEFFFYNNWDFNTLGVIFEQETGKKIFEEFDARIARPVGMEDFHISDGHYELAPTLSKYPAYAFRMSTRDLARFGWLFANDGRWKDRQIVPASWVDESTSAHSQIPGDIAYGYLWWVWDHGVHADAFPHLARYKNFAAQGTGGQHIFVIPEIGFVLVHRGDTDATPYGVRKPISQLAELVLAARVGEPAAGAKLVPVTPVPFANAKPAPPVHIAVKMDPAKYRDYVGVYENKSERRVRVHIYENRLFAYNEQRSNDVELMPEGNDRFFMTAITGSITFERDASGKVIGAAATVFGRPERMRKTN